MVQVTDYKLRQNFAGKLFYSLTLQGEVGIVVSASGSSYLTAKQASLPTTFSEAICKSLIGTQLPGRIDKVETEPYEYTIQETGEVILLHHRFEYIPEELSTNNTSKESINKDAVLVNA